MDWLKWLYPGLKVKRWLLLILLGLAFVFLGIILFGRLEVFFYLLFLLEELTRGQWALAPGRIVGLGILVAGIFMTVFGFHRMLYSILNVVLPDTPEGLPELLFNRRYLKKGPRIVAIGGGTGLSTLLRGLKDYTSNITAIVSVADDGGSSGRLRGELGILPPGDLRNCLIALADREQTMEELLGYRFQQGTTLAGHNVGNLLLAGLAELKGDFHLAVQELSRVLAIRGKVIPATLTPPVLGAELADGEVIIGQSKIARCQKPIKRVFLKPEDCTALTEALQAIREADLVLLGPGSLFTSVIPVLLIKEINRALLKTAAPVAYVCNVATQMGETRGLSASGHVKALLLHGGKDLLDMVVVNTAVPRGPVLSPEGEVEPVKVDYRELRKLGLEIIGGDLIDEKAQVRHDPRKLGRTLIRLILREKKNRARFQMLNLYFKERLR